MQLSGALDSILGTNMTDEDRFIWRLNFLAAPVGHGVPMLRGYLNADRYDSDLLKFVAQMASFGPAAIEVGGVNCRGWSLRSDLTYPIHELSAQDAIAWAHVVFRFGPRGGEVLFTRSLMADGSDATIMRLMRQRGFKFEAYPGAPWRYRIPDTLYSWSYWSPYGKIGSAEFI